MPIWLGKWSTIIYNSLLACALCHFWFITKRSEKWMQFFWYSISNFCSFDAFHFFGCESKFYWQNCSNFTKFPICKNFHIGALNGREPAIAMRSRQNSGQITNHESEYSTIGRLFSMCDSNNYTRKIWLFKNKIKWNREFTIIWWHFIAELNKTNSHK